MDATVKEGQGYRLDAVFNSVHHKINIVQRRQWNFQNQKYFMSFSALLSDSCSVHFILPPVIKNLASWVCCSRALHCTHHYPSATHVHAHAHSQTPLLPPWKLSFGITSSPISCSFNISRLGCASPSFTVCDVWSAFSPMTFTVGPWTPLPAKPTPSCQCMVVKWRCWLAQRWNLISAF